MVREGLLEETIFILTSEEWGGPGHAHIWGRNSLGWSVKAPALRWTWYMEGPARPCGCSSWGKGRVGEHRETRGAKGSWDHCQQLGILFLVQKGRFWAEEWHEQVWFLNDQPGGYIKHKPEGRNNCKWQWGFWRLSLWVQVRDSGSSD